MNFIKKILINIQYQGTKKTIKKILDKLLNIITFKSFKKDILKKKILEFEKTEDRFSEIYKSNYWSDNQSRSGKGSNLESTENIRLHLPIILKKNNIKTIFDAPCGDLNWMIHILKKIDIKYHGSDIVPELINHNKEKYENENIRFSKLDITKDKLPRSDLMICRDLLFHLSYNDIFLFFDNFLSSEINYILLNSHSNNNNIFENKDIITGDFRLLDIFSEPLNFKREFIYKFDDRDIDEIKNFKMIYLFKKEQISKNLKKNI